MKAMMTTPQQLGRTEVTLESAAVQAANGPSKAWRAAFDAQLTPDLMDDVTAYAAKRAGWIEQRTGRRDPGLIEEMVQDAIGDTFAAVVAWDPDRFPLSLHLKTVIRSRLSHEIERLEAYEHVDVTDTPEAELSEAMETASSTSARADLDRYADDFETRLRELAVDDDPVLRLIDCYRDGITERREVCRITKMSTTTYHNAHRRLKRLVENLPDNLRASALTALT